MIGWLLRLFGIGGKQPTPRQRQGAAATPAARAKAKPTAAPADSLNAEQFKLARRRVVMYIARARIPVRQAAAARQVWIADLSKVYEAIRTSPTEMILEKAGDVGMKHEEAFRDALSLAQSIEPPVETEEVHQALVNWLTNLHSACLALMDARRLKDRAMLGMFRERLGHARRHAAALAQARNQLFADYQLRIDPQIKKKKEGEAEGQPAAEAPPAPMQRRPVPIRSARAAAAARRARPGTRRPPQQRRATG
jgi:hypothetical protein